MRVAVVGCDVVLLRWSLVGVGSSHQALSAGTVGLPVRPMTGKGPRVVSAIGGVGHAVEIADSVVIGGEVLTGEETEHGLGVHSIKWRHVGRVVQAHALVAFLNPVLEATSIRLVPHARQHRTNLLSQDRLIGRLGIVPLR